MIFIHFPLSNRFWCIFNDVIENFLYSPPVNTDSGMLLIISSKTVSEMPSVNIISICMICDVLSFIFYFTFKLMTYRGVKFNINLLTFLTSISSYCLIVALHFHSFSLICWFPNKCWGNIYYYAFRQKS